MNIFQIFRVQKKYTALFSSVCLLLTVLLGIFQVPSTAYAKEYICQMGTNYNNSILFARTNITYYLAGVPVTGIPVSGNSDTGVVWTGNTITTTNPTVIFSSPIAGSSQHRYYSLFSNTLSGPNNSTNARMSVTRNSVVLADRISGNTSPIYLNPGANTFVFDYDFYSSQHAAWQDCTNSPTITINYNPTFNATVNQAPGQTDPTNISPITFRTVFAQAITPATFTAGDITVTNGTVTGGPTMVNSTTFDFEITPSGQGTVSASLPAGVVSTASGTTNAASTSTDNSVLYDSIPPTVSITRKNPTGESTNATTATFQMEFSEAVQGVFVTVDASEGVNADIQSITPISSTLYDVVLENITGEGVLRILIPSTPQTRDSAGNPLEPSTGITLHETYTIDKQGPTYEVERSYPTSPITFLSHLLFRIIFNEEVSGVDISDFSIVSSDTVVGIITDIIQHTANIYDVEVTLTEGEGDVWVELTGIVSDLAGNTAEVTPDTYEPYTIETTSILTGITPNQGPTTGGTTVVIDGDGFMKEVEFVEVSAGKQHTCALDTDGQAYCWGGNDYGQIGNGNTDAQVIPVAILPGEMPHGISLISISAGQNHTCALGDSGEAYCWGQGGSGQLGNGLWGNVNTPVAVVQGDTVNGVFVKVVAGQYHTCGIGDDDWAYCWGHNGNGELGIGNNEILGVSAPAVVSQGLIPGGVLLTQITAKYDHTCVLGDDSQAYCWGRGSGGRLGNGLGTNANVPVVVSGGHNFEDIDASTAHTCAIDINGNGYCWGSGSEGELGNGSPGSSNVPVLVEGGHSFISIAAGGYHSCAVDTYGNGYCWGWDPSGQLGNGPGGNSLIPALVDGGHVFTSIQAGLYYSCALTTAKQLYCWGNGTQGQIGDGNTVGVNPSPVATMMPSFPIDFTVTLNGAQATITNQTTTQITVTTPAHIAGPVDVELTSAETLPILLPDAFTYLNPAPTVTNITPSQGPVTGGTTVVIDGDGFMQEVEFVQIDGGLYHTCGTTNTGEIYCWGYNYNGQLGDGTNADKNQPVLVQGNATGKVFTQIAAGYNHTCGATNIGEIYCWGDNYNGQLGDGTNTNKNQPVLVQGNATGKVFTQIAVGWNHTCGTTDTGEVYCWGDNYNGQLGDGTNTSKNQPVLVQGNATGKVFTQITAGGSHTCGINNTGEIYCWGYNGSGQLGDGTNGSGTDKNQPVLVQGNATGKVFTQIAAGNYHTCGTTDAGEIYCWGYNSYGQLGDGTNGSGTDKNLPVLVQGNATGKVFTQIATGGSHTCGTTNTGEIYCWGYNFYGQLGDGTSGNGTDKNQPVLVQGNATGKVFTQIAAGNYHTCGTTDAGEVYCWGRNDLGELGDGTNGSGTNKNQPTLILDGEFEGFISLDLTLTFDDIEATITNQTATQLTATTPANPAGLADLAFTAPYTYPYTELDAFLYRPVVTSITRHNPTNQLTSSGTVFFAVEFSDPVSLPVPADFSTQYSGEGNALITSVTQGDSTSEYIVEVETMGMITTVQIALSPTHTIVGADNSLVDHTVLPDTNEYYIFDRIPPAYISSSVFSPVSNTLPLAIIVYFDKELNSVTPSINGSSTAFISDTIKYPGICFPGGGHEMPVVCSSPYYVFQIDGVLDGETVSLSFLSGSLEDIAGNQNSISYGPTEAVTYDSSNPTVSITRIESNPTKEDLNRFLLTFSEIINGLSVSDFIASSTLGRFPNTITQLSPTTYEVSYTKMATETRNRIARLHPNGTVDTSFTASANASVFATAVQSDGKILVGGAFTEINGVAQAYLARLHTDGSLDTSFTPSIDNTVRAIAVDASDNIVIGGNFGFVNSTTRGYLARLLADGTLDVSFSPTVNNIVYTILLDDSDIFIGGAFTLVNSVSYHRLAKLDTAGNLDTSFINPQISSFVYATPAVYDLALQDDGALIAGGPFTVVAGQGSGYAHLVRILPDGALDMSFSTSISSTVLAVQLDTAQNIIVGTEHIPYIQKIQPNGTTDAGFTATTNGSIRALHLTPEEHIWVGGSFASLNGESTHRRLGLLEENGSLSTSAVGPSLSGANVVAITQDAHGRIIVGGEFYEVGTGYDTLTHEGEYELEWKTPSTVTDVAGNPLLIPEGISLSEAYAIDLTGPTVTVEQSTTQNDPTNGTSVTFDVTFNEQILVSSFTAGDIQITGTATTGTPLITDSGTGSGFVVTVPVSSDGSVTVTIPAGGVEDLVGNLNSASTSLDNTVLVDTSNPIPTIKTALILDTPVHVSRQSPLEYYVIFDKAINATTLEESDFLITGSSSAIVTSISPITRSLAQEAACVLETIPPIECTGYIYRIDITGMLDGETITLTLPAGEVLDLAGNENLVSVGEQNSILYDVSDPTYTVTRVIPDHNPTYRSALTLAVEFNEAVTGVDPGDFSEAVEGDVLGDVSTVEAITPNLYHVTLDLTAGTSGSGSVVINAGSGIMDLAGNDLDVVPTLQEFYDIDTDVVTAVTPDKGPVTGGQTVVIDGDGFMKEVEFVEVSGYGNHTCGVTDVGEMYCWGYNGFGQLGNGTYDTQNEPVLLHDGEATDQTFTKVSAGDNYTCGVTDVGEVYCWGRNDLGQLGDGTNDNINEPVLVHEGEATGQTFIQVSTGGFHTCGMTDVGEVYCWGYNATGQLGDGTNDNTNEPVLVQATGQTFIQVNAGTSHTCGVTDVGEVYCWGSNLHGQLGDGTNDNTNEPVLVHEGEATGQMFTQVNAGTSHTCGVTDIGEVYCWGRNNYGQLGDETNDSTNEPVLVHDGESTGQTFIQVNAGGFHTCGVTDTGEVYCWGRNDTGQLGDGTNGDTNEPVLVHEGEAIGQIFIQVSAGVAYTCGVTNVGAVYCWGYNASGQLGDGTNDASNEPVLVHDGEFSNIIPIDFTLTIDGIEVDAADVTVLDNETIEFITPTHAAGFVDIELSSPDTLPILLTDAYLYQEAPVITDIVPNTGLYTGGTEVIITGQNFTPGVTVTFDGEVGQILDISLDGTTITVLTPEYLIPGPVDVVVTNNDAQTTTEGGGFTYFYPAPTVTHIHRFDPAVELTNATTVIFEVLFSENVVSVETSDFLIDADPEITALIDSVTGSDATYYITVSPVLGTGALTIDVDEDHEIFGINANRLDETSIGTHHGYIIDQDIPIATIARHVPLEEETNLGNLTFRVTFNEDVDNVDTDDFTVTLGSTVTTVTSVSAQVYDVTVENYTDGVVSLGFDSGHNIADSVGNLATLSTAETYTVNRVQPNVTIEQASSQADPTNTLPVNFTVSFDKVIETSSFTAEDLEITGSAIYSTGAVVTEITPQTVFAVSIPLDSEGTVTLTLPAGSVTDIYGNPNTVSTSLDNTITYDITGPQLSFLDDVAVGPVTSDTVIVQASDTLSSVAILEYKLLSNPICNALTYGSGGTAFTSGNTLLHQTDESNNGNYVCVYAEDTAGNSSYLGSAHPLNIDSNAPSITFVDDVELGPVQSDTITITATDSNAIVALEYKYILEATCNSTTYGTGSGTAFTSGSSFTMNTEEYNEYYLCVFAQDETGLQSFQRSTNYFTIDITQPTASISRSIPLQEITNTTTVIFTVTFNEPVTGVDTDDFDTTLGDVLSVSGSNTTYDVVVNNISTSGTVTLTFANDATITDVAGNSFEGVVTGTQEYTIDLIAPTMNITRLSPLTEYTRTTGLPLLIQYRILFDEHVLGLGMYDFAMNYTGAGLSHYTTLEEVIPGYEYIAHISLNSDGMVGLTDGIVSYILSTGHGITDLAGNPLDEGESTTSISTVVDNIPPSVTITPNTGQLTPTNTSFAEFQIIFSEPILPATFTEADFTITGGTLIPGSLTEVGAMDHTHYTVQVDTLTEGLVTAHINANQITDRAGNGNYASTDTGVVYDITPPTIVSITRLLSDIWLSGSEAPYVVTFSEPVTNVQLSDFLMTTTHTATMTGSGVVLSGTTAQIDYTAVTGSGTLAITPALLTGITDLAGNPLSASTPNPHEWYRKDGSVPTVPTITILTTQNPRPILTGTFDIQNTLTVTVDGTTYTLGVDPELTTNHGGQWVLDLSTSVTPLNPGVYDIQLTSTNKAGNSSTDMTLNELTIDTVTAHHVITGQLSNPTLGQFSQYNIPFQPTNPLTKGSTIVLTFPGVYGTQLADLSPADIAVTSATPEFLSATTTIDPVTRQIFLHIDTDGYPFQAPDTIDIHIGDGSLGGFHDLTNPTQYGQHPAKLTVLNAANTVIEEARVDFQLGGPMLQVQAAIEYALTATLSAPSVTITADPDVNGGKGTGYTQIDVASNWPTYTISAMLQDSTGAPNLRFGYNLIPAGLGMNTFGLQVIDAAYDALHTITGDTTLTNIPQPLTSGTATNTRSHTFYYDLLVDYLTVPGNYVGTVIYSVIGQF